MNIKFLLACLLMLGAAERPFPQLPLVTNDPNDPEKTRSVVYREEREKLGLTPHTWAGVVNPDVYATLDRLNKTIASLKDSLKKGRDTQASDLLHRHRARFEGTVYVQVQVKTDPNIRDVQRRVLASLRASEFHAPYLFEKSAGLTGYVTKEGLDKLAKHPEVLGVCLDDKPLPEKGKTIYKDDLPPAKPGESANEPGVDDGKVDPDVYRSFDLIERAYVMVNLRPDSLPKPGDLPSDLRARNELRNRAEKQLQDRVLSTVSADDFWLWVRLGSGMSGFVNKEGLQNLQRHPDVLWITLDQLVRFPMHGNIRNFSP